MLRTPRRVSHFLSRASWTRRGFSTARDFVACGGLRVDPRLHATVQRILHGTGTSEAKFWAGLQGAVEDLAPKNALLLKRRAELQGLLDVYHAEHPDPSLDLAGYEDFLKRIGYLVEPRPRMHGAAFACTATGVDPEVGQMSGPQLVFPVDNARFAVNAANARWGSLGQALSKTDALLPPVCDFQAGPDTDQPDQKQQSDALASAASAASAPRSRAEAVTAALHKFLDETFPLAAVPPFDTGVHSSGAETGAETGADQKGADPEPGDSEHERRHKQARHRHGQHGHNQHGHAGGGGDGGGPASLDASPGASRDGTEDAPKAAAVRSFVGHGDLEGYRVERGRLVGLLKGTHSPVELERPGALAGYQGPEAAPEAVLLEGPFHGAPRVVLELRVDKRAGAVGSHGLLVPGRPLPGRGGQEGRGKDDAESGDTCGPGEGPGGSVSHPGQGGGGGAALVRHVSRLADVTLESALTCIADLEDSVSAVDAEDKAKCYANWEALCRGTLVAPGSSGAKAGGGGKGLAPPRRFTRPRGSEGQGGFGGRGHGGVGVEDDLVVPGRAVLLVRNVGLHLSTDAVLHADEKHGSANARHTTATVPEGFLDAFVTAAAAVHSLASHEVSDPAVGRQSIYIVKPKLHGPDEVAATMQLFDRVEDTLGLARHTVKLGLMDEERRTSVNLAASVAEAAPRLIFLNTGFLDRTADEVHSALRCGRPVLPKDRCKAEAWYQAYEDENVAVALAAGLHEGHGQIGKGMWPAPDSMREMLALKGEHLRQGASTSWVPSPNAACLHALHYHQVDVRAAQRCRGVQLAGDEKAHRRLLALLTPPLVPAGLQPGPSSSDSSGGEEKASLSLYPCLDAAAVKTEVELNAQAILGYVGRWVNEGVGCSKVPNLQGVGLMEDRATLRVASQLLCNWLKHGVCSEKQVTDALLKMAALVDAQNAQGEHEEASAKASNASNYVPYGPDPARESVAFQAALELVLDGAHQPNGYTEPILYSKRRQVKAHGPVTKEEATREFA